jgi:large subunit ribosomal protein L13
MNTIKKTYSQKASDISRQWVLIDASSAPLGKVATIIATYLVGKHKPTFTPHIDNGDYVVVINASKLVVTGNKLADKKYFHHSGYPGGIKETSLDKLKTKNPEAVVLSAVKGMIPRNKLAAERLARLKVFAGAEHKHAAQMPTPITIPSSIKKGVEQ